MGQKRKKSEGPAIYDDSIVSMYPPHPDELPATEERELLDKAKASGWTEEETGLRRRLLVAVRVAEHYKNVYLPAVKRWEERRLENFKAQCREWEKEDHERGLKLARQSLEWKLEQAKQGLERELEWERKLLESIAFPEKRVRTSEQIQREAKILLEETRGDIAKYRAEIQTLEYKLSKEAQAEQAGAGRASKTALTLQARLRLPNKQDTEQDDAG